MATKSQKLEDQAATAALYVTRGQSKEAPSQQGKWPLDADNKLSSASAATSLKYAQPHDLPSYPITGMPDPDSSAGAAASLANANHKDFEYWKPESSTPANKAAAMAKDYKMAPLWHPEQSAAGSKAAILAQKEGGQVNIWRPESTDAGESAAGQAMRKKNLSPNVNYGVTQEGGEKALMAATGAVRGSRKRAGSTPVTRIQYPDSENAASNALSAATIANRPAKKQPQAPPPTGMVIDAKKIHNAAVTNLSREMYTSHPPVAPEQEEQKREAGLRAAAISMAKQMYDVQQKLVDEAAADKRGDSHRAATSAHNRPGSMASSDESHNAAPQFVNLQEAAQKLAAERLGKLNDEHAAYRNYYGASTVKPQSRLSIRGRQRQRASSDGQGGDDDAERSKQIRSQMSLFQDNIAQVDAKKRQKDRDSLLAAAQRNVRASMNGMDEKVFSETGKASPAMMQHWETKAKAKAKADSETRMVNHGKVHIGGGKYMDQSEVEAIAAAKVQPTLDEVTAKAEKQIAHDEAVRAEREERIRLQREKEADQKTRDQMTKEEWKRFRDEEKREAKAKKEEEKAKKAEAKQAQRERESNLKKLVGPEAAEPMSGNESEPPALAPIPKTEPIDVESPVVGPEVPPAEGSSLEKTTTTDTKYESVNSEPRTSFEPTSSTEGPSDPLGSVPAEMTALRVLSSPVDEEGTKAVPVAELLKANSDLNVASESTPEGTEPTMTEAPAAKPAATTEPASTSPTKHTEPVTSRIAPSIPSGPSKTAQSQPTSKTTITADRPSKPQEPKPEGKVSSWLKSKLSRKPAAQASCTKLAKTSEGSKAEPPASESTPEKGFAGGATLAAKSNTSVNRSGTGDTEREVAMAGQPAPASAVAAEPAPKAKEPTQDLSGAAPAPHRSISSSSISSLSSSSPDDEDGPRGRTRLPREPKPMQHSLRASMRGSGGGAEGDVVPVEGKGRRDLSQDSSDEGFEEARDTFDAEGGLKMPPKVGVGSEAGRASDSPVRDSRFMEDL